MTTIQPSLLDLTCYTVTPQKLLPSIVSLDPYNNIWITQLLFDKTNMILLFFFRKVWGVKNLKRLTTINIIWKKSQNEKLTRAVWRRIRSGNYIG